jgi:hypothetical protein
MGVSLVVRVLRIAAAVLGIAALATAAAERTGSLANYFSFFTIESNMLAAAMLLVGGLLDPRSDRWASVRGAITLYMTITGIVYAGLLSGQDVGLTGTGSTTCCTGRSRCWCWPTGCSGRRGRARSTPRRWRGWRSRWRSSPTR